jgi:hypothetical protein
MVLSSTLGYLPVQVLLLDEPTGDLDTLRVAADPNRIGASVTWRAETEIRPTETEIRPTETEIRSMETEVSPTETLTETAAVPGAAGCARRVE